MTIMIHLGVYKLIKTSSPKKVLMALIASKKSNEENNMERRLKCIKCNFTSTRCIVPCR